MADGQVGNSIYDNLHPTDLSNFDRPETKLMINLLTGGKLAGSTCRYSRIYLIVDPYANMEINIPHAMIRFQTELKKKFASVKGGEAAFKLQDKGSYFNAFPSATDAIKNIEEAINTCGANGSAKPTTSHSGSAKNR